MSYNSPTTTLLLLVYRFYSFNIWEFFLLVSSDVIAGDIMAAREPDYLPDMPYTGETTVYEISWLVSETSSVSYERFCDSISPKLLLFSMAF